MTATDGERTGKRHPARNTPTISRICGRTLAELVYDRETKKTGLVISHTRSLWNIEQEFQIETGEMLVPYSPNNNLIANECIVFPSKPEISGDKRELLADIQSFVHRYVDLSPLFEQIAVHYILLTWLHDAFSELGYLRLRGDYGTGKTRALTVLGSLCYKGFFASGASTVSPIFHVLDSMGGTLIFDEADLPFSDARAEMVKVFNNGTMPGMPVLRTMMNRHKEFNPQAFKVYGPKIIAMRGSFEDRALESRFLTEETGTRPLRDDVPLFLPPSMKAEALSLRNRLLHFRLCNFFDINTDATALIEGIEPRLNQTALSLLSLVDDADVRSAIQAALVEENANTLSERRETLEGAVLASVVEAFAATDGENVPIRDIAERFNATHRVEYGGPVSNRWIGNMLRKGLRLTPHKSNGIYVVPISEKSKIDVLAKRMGV
ncbi:MAG: hypothetical protein EPO08_02425 [Rhodospirillaceae bacterium]|nr:MAG: hypothetical protein EPO08_02425 [Rhodospirillaceae bacterium]